MVNLIFAELKKLKRSNMIWISIAGCSILPIVALIIRPVQENEHWRYFSMETLWPAILLLWPGVFGLFGSYLFNRERIENTYKNLWVIPVDRICLAISKLIVLLGWIEIMCIFSYLLNLPAVFYKVTFYSNEFWQGFFQYLLVGVLMFAAILPVIFVAVLSRKGYILSMSVSIIYAFISFMSLWSEKISSFVPVDTILRILNIPKVELECTYPLSVSCTIFAIISIISLIGILWLSKNQDI